MTQKVSRVFDVESPGFEEGRPPLLLNNHPQLLLPLLPLLPCYSTPLHPCWCKGELFPFNSARTTHRGLPPPGVGAPLEGHRHRAPRGRDGHAPELGFPRAEWVSKTTGRSDSDVTESEERKQCQLWANQRVKHVCETCL